MVAGRSGKAERPVQGDDRQVRAWRGRTLHRGGQEDRFGTGRNAGLPCR